MKALDLFCDHNATRPKTQYSYRAISIAKRSIILSKHPLQMFEPNPVMFLETESPSRGGWWWLGSPLHRRRRGIVHRRGGIVIHGGGHGHGRPVAGRGRWWVHGGAHGFAVVAVATCDAEAFQLSSGWRDLRQKNGHLKKMALKNHLPMSSHFYRFGIEIKHPQEIDAVGSQLRALGPFLQFLVSTMLSTSSSWLNGRCQKEHMFKLLKKKKKKNVFCWSVLGTPVWAIMVFCVVIDYNKANDELHMRRTERMAIGRKGQEKWEGLGVGFEGVERKKIQQPWEDYLALNISLKSLFFWLFGNKKSTCRSSSKELSISESPFRTSNRPKNKSGG